MQVGIPTIITIFGATGDLAKGRLYRALFSLFMQGMLPQKFQIVGFAKDELTDRTFQDLVIKSCGSHAKAFAQNARYQTGFFEEAKAYTNLGNTFLAWDKKWGTCSNKLFHLAVPPKYYKTILENLAVSGLAIPCADDQGWTPLEIRPPAVAGRRQPPKGSLSLTGWTRVLVEKPFGSDAHAALELDELLSRLFREEQIFRIDHYLARETMQNILTFRFSNRVFEPLWSNQYIEKVEIKLLEKGGVGERGSFYDEIGALKDVGQNHMLQMLALVAMGHPQRFETQAIRRERAKVLEALRPIRESEAHTATSRGQYEGYTKLAGVRSDSQTETYFKLQAFVDNARWSGVPFLLESGKGLEENIVAIHMYFKAAMPCFCPPPHEGHYHQNKLSFMIKPKEGIAIRFWVKKPGLSSAIEAKNLSFSYGRVSPKYQTQEEAYEKVLFDCIQGEQVLFASTDEVKAAWRFIMPILNGWEKSKVPLIKYKKGGDVKNQL